MCGIYLRSLITLRGVVIKHSYHVTLCTSAINYQVGYILIRHRMKAVSCTARTHNVTVASLNSTELSTS